MLDAILGSLFGKKTETKKIVSGNVSDRVKKRKLIIQKFRSVDPNDNLKRVKIVKELLSVSRTEGERKAARKFYKDETELNNLKNKIKSSESVNEKLSLARQGKRLATKKQKEFWENLINRLQKRKQDRIDAIASKKETLVTTNISKEQDKEQDKEKDKDMEEIEEKKERSIEENESGKDSDNDMKEPEESYENEEPEEDEEDGDDNEDEEDDDEDEEEGQNGMLGDDINDEEKGENLT